MNQHLKAYPQTRLPPQPEVLTVRKFVNHNLRMVEQRVGTKQQLLVRCHLSFEAPPRLLWEDPQAPLVRVMHNVIQHREDITNPLGLQ